MRGDDQLIGGNRVTDDTGEIVANGDFDNATDELWGDEGADMFEVDLLPITELTARRRSRDDNNDFDSAEGDISTNDF